MTTVMVELLVAGLIFVLAALLARVAWLPRRRRDLRGPITEVQARENGAPLTKAILASNGRDRTDL